MINIENVAPFPAIKPRRRTIDYCISVDEGKELFARWRQRFPKLRYMAPVKNIAPVIDVPEPPEMVISASPFDLPHNRVVAGLLIGDRWKPKWRQVPYFFEGSTNWQIENLPWPCFNLVPPDTSDVPYLAIEDLHSQYLRVIWDYGNEAGPGFARYLFSTIRRLLKVEEAIALRLNSQQPGWYGVRDSWRIKCSQGALAWAAAKPRRLANRTFLPVDADPKKLGFGDLPQLEG